MALATLRQLLDHAAENDYGLPAFNVNNMEQVKAIMIVPMKLIALLFYRAQLVHVSMPASLS